MIAVLGTGLLGSNFTRALVKKGEVVHVWNRTLARAKALEAEGAKAFDDPAAAVKGASRVHIVVSDDAAVDGILEQIVREKPFVIDHTTTSTEGARRRTSRSDVTYVHVPVFMGPVNALESTGLMLVSGDRARVERVRPLLEPMTVKVWDCGERVDAAAAFKLLGNTFLMGFATAIADMIGLGKALGIPATEAVSLFDHFNPGALTTARAKRIATGDFSKPSWELAMARKDARLVQSELPPDLALILVPAIAAKMDEMIARGHTHDDWLVIAKDFVGRNAT